MKIFNGRVCITLLVLMTVSMPALSDVLDADYLKELQGKSFTLRRTVGAAPVVYLKIDEHEYYYVFKRGRIFPVRAEEPVSIYKARFKTKTVSGDKLKYVDLWLKSENLGKQNVRIFSPETNEFPMDHTEKILSHLFVTDIPINESLYALNTESMLIHSATSNHLPDASKILYLKTHSEAVELGGKDCRVCFQHIPGVSDYFLERQLGLVTAAKIRYYHHVVVDDEAQRRIRRLGKKVLDHWPLPLKGYRHEFYLIESDAPNALAVPAGGIFINTELYHSIDSDTELEAIIAHEIAHIEQRHGYRTLKNIQTAQAVVSILGALAGVVAQEKGASAQTSQTIADMVQSLSGLGASIALNGYSRKYENEADAFAILYFQANKRDGARNDYANVMNKFRYYGQVWGEIDERSSAFATHPVIKERKDRILNTYTELINGKQEFIGLNKEDEEVAAVHLDMLTRYEKSNRQKEYTLLITVETTSELRNKTNIRRLTLVTDNQKIRFKNSGVTVIYPNQYAGFNLNYEGRKDFKLTNLTGIDMPLRNVRRWVSRGDSRKNKSEF